jgi:hypothetical protein
MSVSLTENKQHSAFGYQMKNEAADSSMICLKNREILSARSRKFGTKSKE